MFKGDLKHQAAQCSAAQWMIGAATLLLCTLIALLSVRPTAQRLGQLEHRAAAQRTQLAADQQRAASLAPLQQQNTQLQQQVKAFDQRLGRTNQLPQSIQDVATIARKASLRNLTWRSGEQQSDVDRLAELPIQISFQSEYTGVTDFLHQAAALQRITSVQKVLMKALPGAEGSGVWVDVQLTMNVYFGEE